MVDGGPSNVNPAALYRSVIRAMSEGVVIHGPDGRIIDANPAAQRILGLTLEQMAGASPVETRWRLTLPDGSALDPRQLPSEITRRTGRPHHGHLAVERPDGSVVLLSVHTDPVDDAVAPGFVVATFADESETFAAKRALERERSDLRRLIELVPGGVFQLLIHSGRGEITFMSDRLRSMLDSQERRTLDLDLLRPRIHPEDLADLRDAFLNAAQKPCPLSVEFRYKRSEEWLWFRLDALPELVAGEPRWTCLVIDISADRAMGDRMRRAARREAMGEMAAGLAHNLNNLLAAILPNIELALQNVGDTRPMLEDALRPPRAPPS